MLQRVTDPALMAQLEGGEAPESAPAAAPSGALPKGYSLRPPPAKPQPKTSYTPMSADDKKKYGLDVRFPYFMSSEGKPDLPEGFKPESVEGKPVSEWAAKRFTIPRDQYEPLANATDSFQDDFGGNTLTGSLESQVQALFSDVGTPGQRDWWSNFYQTDMAIRHGLYGSALTPVEKKSYDQATVTPNMDPKEIRRNLSRRRELIRKATAREYNFMLKQGYNPEAVDALAGERAGDYKPDYVPPSEEEKPPGPGDIGFSGNVPPETKNPLSEQEQAAYDAFMTANPKASADDLRNFMRALNPKLDISNAEDIVKSRDAAGGKFVPGSEAVPGLTAEQQAEAQRRVDATGAIGQIGAGAADILSMGTSQKLIAGARSLLGKGDYESELAIANEADRRAQEQHQWLYGGGQLAAGLALPVGEATTPLRMAGTAGAYGAGYGLGSSDTLAEAPANMLTQGTLAAGTAGLLGMGANKVGDILSNRASRQALAQTTAPPAAADLGERAAQYGLDLSRGDVGGPVARTAEKILDYLPGSSHVTQAARDRLAAEVPEAAGRVAGKFGEPTDFRATGVALERGKGVWETEFEKASKDAYEAIPIGDKVNGVLDKTRAKLAELTGKYESNPEMAAAQEDSLLTKWRDALSDKQVPTGALDEAGQPIMETVPSPGLSWPDLKQFRTDVGRELRKKQWTEGAESGDLKQLYGALSEDMRKTAEAQGPEALKAFEHANKLYQEGQDRIDDAWKNIFGKRMEAEPEAAAAKFRTMVQEGKGGGNLKAINAVWKSLQPAERGEIAHGMMQMLGHKAGKFDPETFVKGFDNMSPEAKNVVFGPANKELRQHLDGFADVLREMGEKKSLRSGRIGKDLITGGIAGSPLTLLLFNPAIFLPVAAKMTAVAGGANVMAKMWTNPDAMKWATGFMKMARGAQKAGKDASPEALTTQANLLNKLITKHAGMAPELTTLREAILNYAQTGGKPVEQPAEAPAAAPLEVPDMAPAQ